MPQDSRKVSAVCFLFVSSRAGNSNYRRTKPMSRAEKRKVREKNRKASSPSPSNKANGRTQIFAMSVRWLLIGIVILGVYSNTLNGPFLFDDELSIEKNSSIRTLWPLSSSLWAVRDTPTAGRPVVNFSFALNYALSQEKVAGYHAVNISLHVLNAFLLYLLIARSLKSISALERQTVLPSSLPMIATLMWAVHPLHTETVNYITQRTELLMAFFFLLSMLSSRLAWDARDLRSQLAWQGLCVASCALGMASKEVMVVVPVMVVLYDLAMMNHCVSSLLKNRARFYLCLASTWIVLALLLAANPRGRSVGFGLSIGTIDYITTQCWAVTHYLWLAFWPMNLCGDYGVSTIIDIRVWLPRLVLIGVILGATIWAWGRYRILSFLGLWFFLILAPTTSVVPIVTEPIAERRVYLSLASIILLMVAGIHHLVSRWSGTFGTKLENQPQPPRSPQPWVAIGVCLGITTVWACVSYARNEVYRSKFAFWNDVVQKRPLNARGYQNLGKVCFESKQFELTKDYYERSKELAPANADSYYNLGVWHMNHGDPIEALANFDKALLIMPDKFDAAYNRALLLSRLGRTDESIIGYKNAIRIFPKAAIAHLNLGNVYFAQNRLDESIEMYKAALRLNPKLSEAHQGMGAVLTRQGQYPAAIMAFERAIENAPEKADPYNNLGYCYRAIGQTDRAISAYSKSVSIRPSDADTWNSLGRIHVERSDKAQARQCFLQVLQLQPDAIEARIALQQLEVE
jgi:protein O-mannosyl-transferase